MVRPVLSSVLPPCPHCNPIGSQAENDLLTGSLDVNWAGMSGLLYTWNEEPVGFLESAEEEERTLSISFISTCLELGALIVSSHACWSFWFRPASRQDCKH